MCVIVCLLEEKKDLYYFFLCSLCQNAWLLRLLQYYELFRSEPWCFFPTLKIEGKSSKVNRLHCVAVCLCIRCNEESVVASAPLLQNKKKVVYIFFWERVGGIANGKQERDRDHTHNLPDGLWANESKQ